MTPKCKYCFDKKFYSVWKGIHGSPDFIGDRAIGELPDKHMIPCPRCNVEPPHQGHVIDSTPVSCGKECDCKCFCNESKYPRGVTLDAQCEHCKYLLNNPRPHECRPGKSCLEKGETVEELNKRGIIPMGHSRDFYEAKVGTMRAETIQECITLIESFQNERLPVEGGESVPCWSSVTLSYVIGRLEKLKEI